MTFRRLAPLVALPLMAVVAVLGIAQRDDARADADLSGQSWYIVVRIDGSDAFVCNAGITQEGSNLSIAVQCPALLGNSTFAGTIDPATGSFSATGVLVFETSLAGSVAPDGQSFSGTWSNEIGTTGSFAGSHMDPGSLTPEATILVQGPAICGDDSYEENDVRDDAPPLLQPVEVAELVSCPDDTDWFMFHLFAGDDITIDVMYDDSSGDLNVTLHDPGGGFLTTATPVAPGDQRVEFSAPASGIYYVVIDPPPGATEGIDYTLTLSGDATPTPTPLPSTPTQTPTKALGDVNDDASINSIDASLVLQYTAGLLGSLPNATSADVDINGAVDSIDAALILQYEAGLLDSLPAS